MATTSSSLQRLNDAQLYLLKLFETPISDKQLDDIKSLIANYLAKQVDELSDQVWEDRGMNEEKIDQLLSMHLRRPYQK
jgi:hypothetical protein